METTAPTKTKDEAKLYPETLYYSKRISTSGHQPVYKRLLPDGEPTELLADPSQKLYTHSPDGFQWGYSGSGPAQLALGLLLDATSDSRTALDFYQDFKWGQVAHWGDEWSILRSEILDWLKMEQRLELQKRLSTN